MILRVLVLMLFCTEYIMSHQPIHCYSEIVRFEDVDLASVVYHPVYLNYLERARSQSLIEQGASLKKIFEEGLGIVIASVDMKYIRPLCLEDRFVVASQVDDFTHSIIHMTQAILVDPKDCPKDCIKENFRQMPSLRFYAQLKLVVISQKTMRPAPIPSWLLGILQKEQSLPFHDDQKVI